ncbi:MAG TPA: ATP-binding protein [Anaeromyxobacteraceae bacterium]|nr:ATP-binding protein [Anaeromyxobacteraceae bacterium]
MTRVVEIPASFDDRSFEQFAASYAAGPVTDKMLFDARGTTWASPYAFVTMLAAAQAIADAKGPKPLFTVPDDHAVTSYWAKAGFFAQADGLFEIHGKVPRRKSGEESEMVLPVTPIRASEDVHEVVDKIHQKAAAMLTKELGLEARAAMGFATTLSEACQNVVEHAGTVGWVAVHAFSYRKRLGKRVVVIAVGDAGVGFRRSLEATQAKRIGDRWGDGAALECALIQGISRFRDPGRGQGLQGIKRYLARWDGKISIRSGTAKLAIVPTWDDEAPLQERLPAFPGAQVQITIPAQDETVGRSGGQAVKA